MVRGPARRRQMASDSQDLRFDGSLTRMTVYSPISVFPRAENHIGLSTFCN